MAIQQTYYILQYCIGTIQTNQKSIMKEIKEIKGREKNSWIACKEKEVTSISIHIL